MNRFLPFVIAFVVCLVSTASAQFKLTLNFQQMTPHLNQRFEVRVVDQADNAEVARTIVTSIASADFTLELYALVQGHSYAIDFFADFNNNGVYDPPPADHAWRLMLVNATEDTALTFTHNTNFTDIEWPGAIEFGVYEALWAGRWRNLTFGSTDTITTHIRIDADSIRISSTTQGVFGNPDTVTFAFAETLPSNYDLATDTIRVSPAAPWTGEVTLVNGQLNGTIALPGVPELGLDLVGSSGLTQSIIAYTVTADGVPFANGYIISHEDTVLVNQPTSVEEPGGNVPSGFVLRQNYPNPFNPSTTIRYDLPVQAEVRLTIYNVLGRRVRTLVSQKQPAGSHAVVWDGLDDAGRQLASGVYVYRLTAGEFHKTVKMLLLK